MARQEGPDDRSTEEAREGIRAVLARTGLSMRALSVAMGRDQGYVAAYLDPTRPSRARPTPDDLVAASDATGISLVELLEAVWGIDPRRLADELARLGVGSGLGARYEALADAERAEVAEYIAFLAAPGAADRRQTGGAQRPSGTGSSACAPHPVAPRARRVAPGLAARAAAERVAGACSPRSGAEVGSRCAEVGAVDGGVDLVVVRAVGERDELVLEVGEPGRRAQVEDLAGLVAGGERRAPGSTLSRSGRTADGRQVRAVQQLARRTCLEDGRPRSRSRASEPRPRPVARSLRRTRRAAIASGQSRRGPAGSPYARRDADSSESVRPVSQRRWPSASCSRQAPTKIEVVVGVLDQLDERPCSRRARTADALRSSPARRHPGRDHVDVAEPLAAEDVAAHARSGRSWNWR